MKTNRTVRMLFATCIVLVLGFIVLRMFSNDTPDSAKQANLPTLVDQPLIDPAPILPNNTELGGINSHPTPGFSDLLRINLDAYPQVLDPQEAVLPKEIAFVNLMYEGLTRLDENLATVPAAAESWQYNQDATGLVFTLRPGLEYSDGSPLNALRFETALQRLVDPVTASNFAWLVDAVRGAAEWRQADPAKPGYSRQAYLSRLGIQALDQAGKACTSYTQLDCLTLKLEFTRPAPYFHTVMGLWVAYPVRTDLIEPGEGDWWLRAEKRIGNGPFVLTDLDPFVRARFIPDPGYHGEHPKVTIEFYFISDPQAALQAYRNNRLEIIADAGLSTTAPGPAQAGQVLEDQPVVVPGACSSLIAFGLLPITGDQLSPFTDSKVRQAFVLAFDSQAWLQEVDVDQSIFTGTFIPPGFPASAGISPPYMFDPQLARRALAESTYAGPQALNELGLRLTYPDTPANQARFSWLADNFKKYLDVDLSLDPRNTAEYAALNADPGFAPLLGFQTWCGLYLDPQSWLAEYWREDSSFRPSTGYASPELEALLEQASAAANPAQRLALYTRAHQQLLGEAPAIFGLVSTNRYLVKPWVKGLVPSPFDTVWPGSTFPEKIQIMP